MQNKDDFPLFTSALFGKDGNARTLANISSYDNLVLDFDNENGITDSEDILRELQDYTFIYYTTFSSTEEKKKFRIILPFSKSLDQKSFVSLKDKINYILKDFLDGLDGSCYNDARPFYIPALNCESLFNKGIHFNECKLYLDVDLKEATKIINYQLKKPNGRNDILKAQAFAAFHQGKTIYEVTQELLAYDKANHSPPFFEDPSENHYVKDDPETTAYGFVVSNKKTFRNQGHKVEQTLIINLEEEKKEVKEKKEKALVEISSKLCKPHGLVGEIADWITESSIKPLPPLSLAAALTGLGTIKAHRVCSQTDLRTNIYTVGLMTSGGGKEDSAKAIKYLLRKTGHENSFVGKPKSGSGLLTGLARTKGQAFLAWPEIGLSLKAYTAKNTSSHLAEVLEHLTQLFSSADSVYTGGEYSNNARHDIDQPCLCVYGSSVAPEFLTALSESHGSNGFLARFLIFYSNERVRTKTERPPLGSIPSSILNEVHRIKKMPIYLGDENVLNSIRPKVVGYTPEAKKYFLELHEYYFNKCNEVYESQLGIDSIWNRAIEHIIKISLILSDNNLITKQDLDYSFGLVEVLLEQSSALFLEHCKETEYGKMVKKVLNIITRHKKTGIARGSLQNHYRLPTNLRDSIIKDLVDSDEIIELKINTAKKPKTIYVASRYANN